MQDAWEELHTALSHRLLTGARRQSDERPWLPRGGGASHLLHHPQTKQKCTVFFIVKMNYSQNSSARSFLGIALL